MRPSRSHLSPVSRAFAARSGDERRALDCARAFVDEFPATLSKIAADTKISRNDVHDHLIRARQLGYLQVALHPPAHEELASDLVQGFDLVEAVVADGVAGDREQSVHGLLAPLVAAYLADFVDAQRPNPRELRIGLDGGRTLLAAARDAPTLDVPDKISLEIVPLVAGPRRGSQYSASVICHFVASACKEGDAKVVDPFAINRDSGALDVDPAHRGRDFDLVVVAIGNPEDGFLEDAIRENPPEEEIAGDLCSLAFTKDGRHIPGVHPDRVGLLGLADLARMAAKGTYVVGVAGGSRKAESMRKVLEHGWINVLITERSAAERILSAPTPPGRSPDEA